MRVLLTGATGYVGGRLVGELLGRGHVLRCLARNPDYLRPRVPPGVEVVAGDLLDPRTLGPALEGCEAAFYLAHAMGSRERFEDLERRSATHFAEKARAAGLRRIVYLGGIAHGDRLSPHLASRVETGRILAASGIPTVELRASIILGSGSLSFALLRALVEKLPVLITPRWVDLPAQPIAIRDVLAYLVQALEVPLDGSAVFEIGGPDRLSYRGLMELYAELRGLRRLFIKVPVLTPRLSSLWLGLVTPLYARVGRKLIESLRHETIVKDDGALRVFDVRPLPAREAMRLALESEDRRLAATRWTDALSSSGEPVDWRGVVFGARVLDTDTRVVDADPARVFDVIRRIGGETGWYFGTWLWRVRGLLDLLAGGVGTRRGRRDPHDLRVGDPLDSWRVERIEEGRLLLLASEMRLPGRAWLQFEVEPEGAGTRIRQTAIFDPLGVIGRLYWLALYPVHRIVFRGMLRGLARAARNRGG